MYQQEIAHIIVQSLKATTGKGPSLVKVSTSENVIIVDIKGALTALEQTLLKNSNLILVKAIRKKIMKIELDNITAKLQELTRLEDLRIKSFNLELDYENERLMVLFICNKFLSD